MDINSNFVNMMPNCKHNLELIYLESNKIEMDQDIELDRFEVDNIDYWNFGVPCLLVY